MANKYRKESRAAQRRQKRWRACERKVRFATLEEAECNGVDVYKCPDCGGYHRTSAKRKWIAGMTKQAKQRNQWQEV